MSQVWNTSLLIEEAHVAVSKTHLAGLNTLSHRNNWSYSNISSQSELKRWTSGFDILPPKKGETDSKLKVFSEIYS